MLKNYHIITVMCLCITLSACAKKSINNGRTQWDFDHNLQFRQTKLTINRYKLEVIPNSKTDFDQLSTFLLRKSESLCGGDQYKVDVIEGIEEFDDKRAMPNYIFPSLMAEVECTPKLNKEKN